MRILNIFDAARDGTFDEFMSFYNGDANAIDKELGLNLLQFAVCNNYNPDDKIRIIKFLLDEGADVNFLDLKSKRNALHLFYFCALETTPEYLMTITKLLIEGGVNLNATDRYDAIPLKYAITIVKLSTEDIIEVYEYLLQQGSDCKHKDKFGKSCVDYAKEYSWRNGLLEINPPPFCS